ncbi:MAG: hypothetical protein LBG13_02315 [Holosporales bacterium]|jgi:hypothetical protein|nr:hypothetical protein [Holosporales bacterium]
MRKSKKYVLAVVAALMAPIFITNATSTTQNPIIQIKVIPDDYIRSKINLVIEEGAIFALENIKSSNTRKGEIRSVNDFVSNLNNPKRDTSVLITARSRVPMGILNDLGLQKAKLDDPIEVSQPGKTEFYNFQAIYNRSNPTNRLGTRSEFTSEGHKFTKRDAIVMDLEIRAKRIAGKKEVSVNDVLKAIDEFSESKH